MIVGLLKKIYAWKLFLRDYTEMKRQLRETNNPFQISQWYPILYDRFDKSGSGKGAYFHQDLWAARKIFLQSPQKHMDIGSRVDGFVAHVASFREIEVVDIRPAPGMIENVIFVQADFSKPQKDLLEYCDSISSLHAIEHFGLGRYGDPVDANGYLTAIQNIHLALKPGGVFYFSVPIGKMRIEFNAHRIFDLTYLIEILKPKFEFEEFAYVDDRGELHTDVNLQSPEVGNNFGCREGCGIFQLRKK